jgi:hypothetical protein
MIAALLPGVLCNCPDLMMTVDSSDALLVSVEQSDLIDGPDGEALKVDEKD